MEKHPKILLIGADFDTGNLGVNALAESSVKVIRAQWPEAEITFFASGYRPGHVRLQDGQSTLSIKTMPLRFSKKRIFVYYHFLWYVLFAVFAKLFPFRKAAGILERKNPCYAGLSQADLVMDITGGDSFSDIYGFRRFFLGFLLKWLILFAGKKLILLPQTYGPFRKTITKKLSRFILHRAEWIFVRDEASRSCVYTLLSAPEERKKVRLIPDVAFVLDPRLPAIYKSFLNGEQRTLVGMNISGLLWNHAAERNRQFELQVDYKSLVLQIADYFMQKQNVFLLLIPHVFPPRGYEFESDLTACREMYECLPEERKSRVSVLSGPHDQGEIKYMIGLCDFFLGSRMHSCIAALSQGVPAVGLAYSRKFEGVFRTLDLSNCVANAYDSNSGELMETVKNCFDHREMIKKHLDTIMPKTKETILNMFRPISLPVTLCTLLCAGGWVCTLCSL